MPPRQKAAAKAVTEPAAPVTPTPAKAAKKAAPAKAPTKASARTEAAAPAKAPSAKASATKASATKASAKAAPEPAPSTEPDPTPAAAVPDAPAADEFVPMNRAERRAKGKNRSAPQPAGGGKVFGGHGPASSQRIWSNRRSGG
jgi:hypothetical protein